MANVDEDTTMDDGSKVQQTGKTGTHPLKELDPDKIKVLVNTSYTRPSGELGVPMFSRIGKQTAVEILEFHGEPMVQVDSTAVQKKKAEQAAKKAMEEDVLDEETKHDFKTVNNMIDNQRKMMKQQTGGQGQQSRASGLIFPAQFESLDQMQFYFDQEEAAMKAKAEEDKERAQRVKQGKVNPKDKRDMEELKQAFQNQQVPFKNKILRHMDAAYIQTEQRPDDKCMNWGLHNPYSKLTVKRAPAYDFGKSAETNPQKRFYHVSPCVLNNAECTYETRQKAKEQHQQQFNSILQMREEYFKNRNLKEDFTELGKAKEHTIEQMKRVNIVEGSPREKLKRKKRAQKRESEMQVAAQNAKQGGNGQNADGQQEGAEHQVVKEGIVPLDGQNNVVPGSVSPLAKKKVKLAIDTRRQTLPEKEFSEAFDNLYQKMPKYVQERVMMRYEHQLPSKSMERPSYVGLYAHEFPNCRNKEAKYREIDNPAGKDINYKQLLPHIPNVDFKTSTRNQFAPQGVFGFPKHYLVEGRLVKNEKDLTTFLSKYKPYNSPQFGNWADHDLDEFILREPATQATYHVNFGPVERNDMVGVPDFHRYKQRDPHKAPAESHAASDRIVNAKYNTLKSPKIACAFGKLMSRDNLYQRMHGLPKQTKEEMVKTERRNKAYVSSNEFLPNSYLRSPKRNDYSNSFKTQSLGLFNPDMHESLAESLNQSFTCSFSSAKRKSPSVMGNTESTFARTIMPSEELLATHHRSGSRIEKLSALDHGMVDYDSIYKFQHHYQTPQGQSGSGRTPAVGLDRGGSLFRTKGSGMVQTSERGFETTRTGDSPQKYKISSGVKDAPFRQTILEQGSIYSSDRQSQVQSRVIQ